MNRAILYARVSSQRQADKDLSIPSQFEQMRKYCQEQGWEIVAEIADEAESGRSMRRVGLQKILSLVRQTPPPLDLLVVWKLSRFTRNLRDAVNLEFELKQHGIEVISISEPTDATPIGQSFRDIMHIINQLYSLQLGEDTWHGQAENARRGYWNGGPYPLGYRPQKSTDAKGNIHTKLEIDPENAEVIERIFQMYLLGKGIKAIAIVLNAEGRKTNYGLPFSITTLELAIREA